MEGGDVKMTKKQKISIEHCSLTDKLDIKESHCGSTIMSCSDIRGCRVLILSCLLYYLVLLAHLRGTDGVVIVKDIK